MARSRGVRLGNPDGAEALRRAGKGGAPLRAAISRNAERHALDLAPVVEDVWACGATSLRAIAAELNARGMLTRRGGRWHVSTVLNLLDRLGSGSVRQSRLMSFLEAAVGSLYWPNCWYSHSSGWRQRSSRTLGPARSSSCPSAEHYPRRSGRALHHAAKRQRLVLEPLRNKLVPRLTIQQRLCRSKPLYRRFRQHAGSSFSKISVPSTPVMTSPRQPDLSRRGNSGS